MARWYSAHEPKGEIVIIVEGAPEKEKVKEKDRWKKEEMFPEEGTDAQE